MRFIIFKLRLATYQHNFFTFSFYFETGRSSVKLTRHCKKVTLHTTNI